jgi:hypothetical protein
VFVRIKAKVAPLHSRCTEKTQRYTKRKTLRVSVTPLCGSV